FGLGHSEVGWGEDFRTSGFWDLDGSHNESDVTGKGRNCQNCQNCQRFKIAKSPTSPSSRVIAVIGSVGEREVDLKLVCCAHFERSRGFPIKIKKGSRTSP